MERLILRSLAFEIAVPTSHYFLQRFIQLSASSEIVLDLATVSFQDMLVPNGWENKLISFFAVPL